jgi:hypothetical protein
MNGVNERNLILERDAFTREQIVRRMQAGGFHSIARFAALPALGHRLFLKRTDRIIWELAASVPWNDIADCVGDCLAGRPETPTPTPFTPQGM